MHLFPDERPQPLRRIVDRRPPSPARRGQTVLVASWLARAVALVVGVGLALQGLEPLLARTVAATAAALRHAVAVQLVLPDPDPLPELAERSVVVAGGSDRVRLATLHAEHNRCIVALDELPAHAVQAVLVAEDRRFFEHDGFDPRAVARAGLANLRARDIVQGGSTIPQQLAKTLVGDEVTFERKYHELLTALALERRHDKEVLLERYVNEVYLGAGAYGIEAAAQEYFAVSAAQLRVEQAALLAGLIRSPERLSPRRQPERALARRGAILAGMAAEGYLDSATAARLQALPLGVLPARERDTVAPHIVEAVKREFLALPAVGESWHDRRQLLFEGGVTIETTIDMVAQRRAEWLLREHVPAGDVAGAIVAVDPRDGRVLAAATGRDFHEEQFNLALQGRRHPGSAFKTFVLVAGLEQGLPLSTTLEGRSGATFGTERTTGPWAVRGVRNFGGRSWGEVDARTALVRSVNTAFADLVLRVGTPAMLDVTDRVGISRAAYGGRATPASALGGLDRGVTPLEMASAYGVFAVGGEHARPHLIAAVVDRDGTALYRAAASRERAVDPDVSAVVRAVLEEVVRSGTGVHAQLAGWPVAGKTGTSQDHADVWFAGATPTLAAAVWVGNPDARTPLHGMSSSRTAAPLWRAFMEQELADKRPQAFPGADRPLPAPLLGSPEDDGDET